jgi:hypothetical protein
MSLPSLATFRDDDMSMRSDLSSLYEVGSVVTADLRRNSIGHSSRHSFQDRAQQQRRQSLENTPFVPPAGIGFESGSDPLTVTNQQPAPLVFDKQVDEYIRRIQEQLPTIAEYEGSPSKRGRGPSVASWLDAKASPTPSSALAEDSSVIDELPSLASLASVSAHVRDDEKKGGGSRRKDKKRDPTKSVSSQLIGSIKRIGTMKAGDSKHKRGSVATGDEEKYFPDAEKSNEKTFKPDRGLLNSDDEANWD